MTRQNANQKTIVLHGLLALCFDGQETHSNKGSQNQSTSRVNGSERIGTSVDTNDGSHETRNTVQTAGNSRSGTSVWCREDLGCVGVEHTVHDHLEEGFQAGTDELDVRVLGGGEAEQKDTCDQGGCCHGTLAADVLEVNQVPAKEGTGNTADCCDGVVAVGDVSGGVGAEVLGKEGVEQGVAHSNTCPAEPDQDGFE